jgi:spermidine synthase
MAITPVLFLLLYNLYILLGAFRGRDPSQKGPLLLTILFFFSGMPALVYQIVWQRALFAIYGVNSESVAVVVSAFMIGLGLGSLLGGWLSERFPQRSILFFALAEFGTALFGLVSLSIFHWVALRTAGAPLTALVPLSLGLLVIPTVCMGATLPLLSEHLVRALCPVGYSVGVLYFSNTFGSAVACYLCAAFLLRNFGQHGTVRIAALLNLVVGVSAFCLASGHTRPAAVSGSAGNSAPAVSFLSLRTAMLLSGLIGFLSLGFEIVWFRVFVLASSDRAPALAFLLSTFLAGIAAGAFIAGKLSDQQPAQMSALGMSALLMAAGGLSPFLVPLVAFLRWKGFDYLFAAFGFFLIAALMGAVFPLLCRLALPSDVHAGRGVSLIYVSNIVGSASGSLFIGFTLLNHIGLRGVSALLAAATFAVGLTMLAALYRHSAPPKTAAFSIPAIFLVTSMIAQPFYSNFYERLTFGPEADSSAPIAHVVENRNGVITVLANDAVYGSGVYDGFFNVDPAHDKNLIVRAFAVGAFHAKPARVLIIGLSSGSWAQVLANHPQTESIDIVEINPGYIHLIPEYPAVSSLLKNPKVRIYIDDGRRWLLAHPSNQYDLVLQNTSFYWRDHTSELLSTDYLRIVRRHLNTGGVYYYNTTGSDDVVATGLSVFPHGLRVLNFLAVSDAPIEIDKVRWLSQLRQFSIDSKPVFVVGNPESEALLQKYSELADTVLQAPAPTGLEYGPSMRQRIKDPSIITDDNMGWEWR